MAHVRGILFVLHQTMCVQRNGLTPEVAQKRAVIANICTRVDSHAAVAGGSAWRGERLRPAAGPSFHS